MFNIDFFEEHDITAFMDCDGHLCHYIGYALDRYNLDTDSYCVFILIYLNPHNFEIDACIYDIDPLGNIIGLEELVFIE